MSAQAKGRSRGNNVLDIGGAPRVDLLPPKVRAAAETAVLRKRLGLALVGVVAVVVVAVGASSAYALQNGARLVAAENETNNLLAEQAQYVEVRQVQQSLKAVVDAERVGSWTEVQWRDYLQSVQAALPSGTVISVSTITAASPIEEFAQAGGVLDNARIATIVVTATSPTLPDVPLWLDGLATLRGYAGATPNSIAFDQESNTYTVQMTLQVGAGALAGRFVPPAEAEVAGEETEEQGTN